MKNAVIRFTHALPIWSILLIAAVIRIIHLGTRDFWYDEAFTGILIREPWSKMMDMIVKDVHPPLYYFGAKVFSSLFSYSVVGIRLYSVIFGVAGVFMVYLIAKYLFGKKAGLLSAGIAAIAPFAIQYSQEARMYSQLAFLILASTYFFLRSLQEKKVLFACVWGIMFGLALLTHYMAFLFFPLFMLIAIVWDIRSKRGNIPEQKPQAIYSFSVWKNVLLGSAISGLIFLPWLGSAFYQFKNSDPGLSWIVKPTVLDLVHAYQAFFFGAPPGNVTQGMISPVSHIVGIPDAVVFSILLLFVVFSIVHISLKNRRNGIILALLCLGPPTVLFGISYLGREYFVSRYLLPVVFFLSILSGIWLASVKSYVRYLILGVYILGILLTVRDTPPNGWNAFSKEISTYEPQTLYVLNPFDYVIAKYYFGEDHITLFNADNPENRPTGWAAISDNLRMVTQASNLANERTIIITSQRLDIDSSMPATLSALRFNRITQYGSLYLFTLR